MTLCENVAQMTAFSYYATDWCTNVQNNSPVIFSSKNFPPVMCRTTTYRSFRGWKHRQSNWVKSASYWDLFRINWIELKKKIDNAILKLATRVPFNIYFVPKLMYLKVLANSNSSCKSLSVDPSNFWKALDKLFAVWLMFIIITCMKGRHI